MIKICRTCKLEKDISNFCIVNKNKDGYNHFCRACCCAKYKEYNKEEIKLL